MTGDAPHYLALSHSLLHDYDFELSNQHGEDSTYIVDLDPAERT